MLAIGIAIGGCIQCQKKINKDKNFISVDAEIIGFNERTAKIKYNLFLTIYKTKEYSPIFRYKTINGETIESTEAPFILKISPIYKDYDYLYKTGEKTEISYNPDSPQEFIFKSRKNQHIRSAIYKIIVAFIIGALGALIISADKYI